MRVAHLVPALFGPRGVTGGAERYALELARAMAPRVPTTLLTFGSAPTTVMEQDLTIRTLGPAWHVRGQPSNPLAWSLIGALRPFDVIHCHQQHILASSVAAATSRLTGRTVVVSDLGGGGWDISGYLSTDGWYHAHLHISEYSRRVAGHQHRTDAHVIYGGVDLTRFSPDPAVRREPFALYVGRLLPHKGIDDLIEGLPAGLSLIVAGRVIDPVYLAHLHALATGRSVTFLHEATDDDIVRLYRRALCIVLPSVYRPRSGGETRVPELLGQTLLEGMACGAPALATDVASLPEVVTHERTGLLVPPNDPAALRDALSRLHRDPALARSLGTAARADVEHRFAWTTVVDRCLAIYARSGKRRS